MKHMLSLQAMSESKLATGWILLLLQIKSLLWGRWSEHRSRRPGRDAAGGAENLKKEEGRRDK